MKKVTTLALALFTSAALAGTAMAGPKHGPGPGSERMVKHMTEELNLSEQQQGQVKAIFDEQGKKMRALHDETKGKIDQVLTPEQKAKAKELREERIKHWKEKKAERDQNRDHD